MSGGGTHQAPARAQLVPQVVRNGCAYSGKTGFGTEAAAAREAARLNAKRWRPPGPNAPASAYLCGWCRRWHVGRRRGG